MRVATSDPSHPADVVLLLPEELPGGPAVLPVVLFRWSASPPGGAAGLPFVDRLRSILAAGGIDLRVERIIDVTDPALAAMTGLSAPQEGPSSPSARLALRGGERVAGDALNLFIVDSLPPGVGGWTLGTPGPPLPDTIYSGVIAARLDQGDELARALAHEIGHYLGLRHVESSGPAGARLDDRLADTAPGTGNLMDEDHRGTGITRDQALVMRRHPLLVPRAPAAP